MKDCVRLGYMLRQEACEPHAAPFNDNALRLDPITIFYSDPERQDLVDTSSIKVWNTQ